MGLAYDTPVPTNWFEAFQQLKSVVNASTLQKKVVLLDELTWMDTPKSSMMQAFEYFWNSWASARNDVLLILCSSASSWMLDKVVHDTGGLYHRLNRQIHLRPSPLTWCKCYADANQLGLSDSQIVELYMVLGGIPAY